MDKTEFKKLQTEWYKKLKDSGFVDAENNSYHSPYDNVFQRKAKYKMHGVRADEYYERKTAVFLEKEQYYRLAGQFLYSHEFKTEQDEYIWKKHAEGLTMPEIVKSTKRFKLYIKLLQDTIYRLRAEMLRSSK